MTLRRSASGVTAFQARRGSGTRRSWARENRSTGLPGTPPATLMSTEQETATSFVNSVADVQQADGIYLVVFGDLTTWGKAVGVDTPIADIVKSHQTRDSHSDPVKTLNGVLTQLNVPAASTAPPAWLWPLLAGLVLLLVAATALVWRKRRVAV